MQQQLEMLQSNPSPAELAQKTIDYAEAEAAYFEALRTELPELINIATRTQARPPEFDAFAAAFAIAGEEQEKVADEQTLALLNPNSEIEKSCSSSRSWISHRDSERTK
jgi:hypothetical protein